MEKANLLIAVFSIFFVIYLLIKRRDTKTVLVGAGVIMAIVALNPMAALNSFASKMTTGSLIMAICSSMGFAYVMRYTKCDQHLVKLLTAPLKNVGFFLIPIAIILTFFINIAIPSAAGCSAAVGATLIPVMMASGVKPAMAASAVLAGTFGSMLSPGTSHNAIVAGMAGVSVPQNIAGHAEYVFVSGIIAIIGVSLVALVFKDYDKNKSYEIKSKGEKKEIEKLNFLYAMMPLVPLVILIFGGIVSIYGKVWTIDGVLLKDVSWIAWTNMGVAQAMLIGSILAILVTMTNPEKISKEFFNGMGMAYADIMGIIIAASVFVSGLDALGAIKVAIAYLQESDAVVKWGATFGPFLMAVITGSGDAAAIAFNEAVTPHAATLGYETVKLGMAAADAGAIGRSMSPLAGAAIVCAGLAGVSPTELFKRNAVPMIVATTYLALFML